MRNILQNSLIAFCLLTISCGGSGLVGKFKSLDIRKEGYCEFTGDGHFTLYFKGSKPGHGTFKTDDTRSPRSLELVMDPPEATGKDPGKPRSLNNAGIYKIEGTRLTIKMPNGTDTKAVDPVDFTGDPAYFIGKYERFTGAIPKEFQPE